MLAVDLVADEPRERGRLIVVRPQLLSARRIHARNGPSTVPWKTSPPATASAGVDRDLLPDDGAAPGMERDQPSVDDSDEHLVDQACPACSAARAFRGWLLAWRVGLLGTPGAVRVGTVEGRPVFSGVGDMIRHTSQPFERIHGLEVPTEPGIHL